MFCVSVRWFPQDVQTCSFVLYTWPAPAWTSNSTVGGRHVTSVFASDTARPNTTVHTLKIASTIFSEMSDGREAMPASSAYSIPHNNPPRRKASENPFAPCPRTTTTYLQHALDDIEINTWKRQSYIHHRRQGDSKKYWGEDTPLTETLFDVNHSEHTPSLTLTPS